MNEKEDIIKWEKYLIPGTDVLKNKLNITNLEELKDGSKVTIDGVIEGQPTLIFLSPKLKKIINNRHPSKIPKFI